MEARRYSVNGTAAPSTWETADQEALVANPQGCRGVVTRVPWTTHDNLLNDGLIRVTDLLCANCYMIAFLPACIHLMRKGPV